MATVDAAPGIGRPIDVTHTVHGPADKITNQAVSRPDAPHGNGSSGTDIVGHRTLADHGGGHDDHGPARRAAAPAAYEKGTLGDLTRVDKKAGKENELTRESFGGTEKTAINAEVLRREFQNSVAPALYRWVRAGLNENGMIHGATAQDYVVFDMVQKLSGFSAGDINRNTLLRSDQLDILRLRPSDVDALIHVVGSLEDSMTVAVGLVPNDQTPQGPPESIKDALGRALNIGGDRVSRARQCIGRGGERIVSVLLGKSGEEWYQGLRTKEGEEKARKQMREFFANAPQATKLNGLGMDAFVMAGLQEGATDGREVFRKQITLANELREGRKKIEVMLRGRSVQSPRETFQNPRMKKAAEAILHQPEYHGKTLESLSKHEAVQVAFDARRRVIWEMAEDAMKQNYEHHFQHKSHGRLEQLNDRIAGLKGEAPTANTTQFKELKEAHERTEKAQREQKRKADVATAEYEEAVRERDALQRLYDHAVQSHDAIMADGKMDAKAKEQAARDLKAARDTYTAQSRSTQERVSKARVKKIDEDAVLHERNEEKRKAEQAYDPVRTKSSGDADKDKTARTALEAVKGLFDSSIHNKLVRHMLDSHVLNMHDLAHNEPEENYAIIRRALGIDGAAFDAIVNGYEMEDGKPKLVEGKPVVSNENAKLREFLANAVGYARAEGESDHDFEHALWERVGARTNAELLENIADPAWDSLLSSAVSGEPALHWKDSLRLPQEVAGKRKAEMRGEDGAARMRDVLGEHDYRVGINTLARYIELPGGNMVAVVVNEQGVNQVVDQHGSVIGSMERLKDDGTIVPGENADVIRLQEAIMPMLAEELRNTPNGVKIEHATRVVSGKVDRAILAGFEQRVRTANPTGVTGAQETMTLTDGTQITLEYTIDGAGALTVQRQSYKKPAVTEMITDWESARELFPGGPLDTTAADDFIRRAKANTEAQAGNLAEESLTLADGSQAQVQFDHNSAGEIIIHQYTVDETRTDEVMAGWNDYVAFAEGDVALARVALQKLEKESKALRDREKQVGKISEPTEETDYFAEWENPSETHNPTVDATVPSDYDAARDVLSLRVALSGDTIQLTQAHIHGADIRTPRIQTPAGRIPFIPLGATPTNIPIPSIPIPSINLGRVGIRSQEERLLGPFRADVPVENADLAAANYPGGATTVRGSAQLEQRRRMVLESAYYRYQSLPTRDRERLTARMNTVRVDGVKGGVGRFDIGVENGRLVLWDRSDPAQLSPPSHDAMDYLNDQLARGAITAEDMRKVRERIGLESLRAQQLG